MDLHCSFTSMAKSSTRFHSRQPSGRSQSKSRSTHTNNNLLSDANIDSGSDEGSVYNPHRSTSPVDQDMDEEGIDHLSQTLSTSNLDYDASDGEPPQPSQPRVASSSYSTHRPLASTVKGKERANPPSTASSLPHAFQNAVRRLNGSRPSDRASQSIYSSQSAQAARQFPRIKDNIVEQARRETNTGLRRAGGGPQGTRSQSVYLHIILFII